MHFKPSYLYILVTTIFTSLPNLIFASDNCATATSITSNTSCVTTAGNTTSGYTNSGIGCATGNSDDDIWYSFVAIETSHTVTVNGGADFDAVLAVYTSCGGGSPTGGACVDATGTDGNEVRNLTGLTVGATYYIKVHDYAAGGGNFTICVTHVSTSPPPNDACAAAINLPCGTSNLAGTTAFSVSETHGTGCTSSNYGVWYTFAGDGLNTTITISGGSLDTRLALVSGTCASKTNIACVDASGSGGTETYTFTSVIGTTYFVYVAYYTTGTTTGTFNISRTCVIPPVNDACASATNLPCGTSNLAGTTVNSSTETHGTGCTMSGNGVWYAFTGDGQNTTITVSGGTLDAELAITSGTCASKTNITCQDNAGAGGTESYTFTTVNGTTYLVYVGYYGTGTTTGTFNISRTCAAAPTPPANDACASATNLPCGTSNLAGTTVNAVAETAPPSCGMSQYGVWYSFTGNGQSTTVTLQGQGGFDTGLGIYTGTCGSMSYIACEDATFASDPETYTFTTTNGTVYYVYVSYYTTGTTTGAFTISRTCTAAPTPPSNDACGSATTLPCGTSNLAGTTVNSAIETLPGCSGYVSNYGVWYTFVGDGNASTITVTTTNFDAGFAVFSGTCASKTQLYCVDNYGNSGSETVSFNTTNGTTYFIYVAYYDDWYNTTGTFTISRACIPPGSCPTSPTNDFCAYASPISQGPGTFSATTDGTYTADQTQIDNWLGNGTFCGSIENNSWYSFTASSTTESFPITSVTGCNFGYGIQGHVYSIGYASNGCCSTFSPVSNCYNPGNTSLGTITATSLTVGNQYVLMIDGNAGDGCEYTISGWSVTPLPVELLDFSVTIEEYGDVLTWKTASEINNDFFEIRHSTDGIHYTTIGRVDGIGNSSVINDYSFVYQDASMGDNYYQIIQTDMNGFRKPSEVVMTQRTNKSDFVVKVYPNPTTEKTFFEYFTRSDKNISYRLMDYIGNEIQSAELDVQKGNGRIPIDLKELPAGIYILEINSADDIQSFRIIKN